MNIRAKITLTFFLIVIIILSVVSIAIFFSSASYRESDFYRRLKNRAISTAKILTEFEEVEPELLRRIESEDPANLPNQYVIIFNYKNEVIYSSETNKVIPVNNDLLNRIRLENEVHFKFGDFEALGFLFTEKYDRFAVIAAATDVYGFDALKNLQKIMLIVFAVSVILVSVSGWIYAGRVLKPISKIVDEVDTITEASLDLRLDEGSQSDELDKLAQTFNRMLTRLEEAFLSQKNFIANASHELRTPIAVIVAEIEASLFNADASDPHTVVLKSLRESARGLNTLTTQLLLLAQTSTLHSEKRFKAIRVDEILWEVKQDLEKAHPQYTIDIHFDLTLNDESLVIKGDEHLIKIVFTNIIDNGCKYSPDNSVMVTLRMSNENKMVIDFSNKGRGIEKEDLNSIFTPFFRGSNTKSIKGYGIGLPLASRIVKLHKGTISVESVPGQLTTFVITFPGNK